jgi:hypothetical protein
MLKRSRGTHTAKPEPTNADPIFAAIERVRRAELGCEGEHAPLSAGPRFWRARSAFVRTVPTTRAGVAAFVSYLHEAQVRTCGAAPYLDCTEDAEAYAATLNQVVSRALGFEPWKAAQS